MASAGEGIADAPSRAAAGERALAAIAWCAVAPTALLLEGCSGLLRRAARRTDRWSASCMDLAVRLDAPPATPPVTPDDGTD